MSKSSRKSAPRAAPAPTEVDLKATGWLEMGGLQGPVVVDDLVKIYKRGKIEVVALRGLSCEILPGKITVVMGPSGCGKTTFLNLLGGLDVPNAGKILFNRVDVTKLDPADLEAYRNRQAGFVFQFMNLIPTLTARENVTLPMLLRGALSRSEREQRASELLHLVEMEDRADHKPDALSGGEQQRVAIATALANNPNLILADEPTGELDSESRETVLRIFRDLIEEYPHKAVVLVTHDPAVQRIADVVLQIHDGEITNALVGDALAVRKEMHQAEYSSERLTKLVAKFDRVRGIVSDLQDVLDEE